MREMKLWKFFIAVIAIVLNLSSIANVTCNCDPFEEPNICVNLGNETVPMTMCDYNCLISQGEENIEIVNCPDGMFEIFDCDCDTQDDVMVCVEDEYGAQFPIPACIYECITNAEGPVFELIDCEGILDNGETSGDCDCDAAEDEVICIADEFGNIMPVPACDFQCNGDVLFPNATVVDCELIDGEVTELDCDCTGQEEEIVCVQDETGAQFPISACLYECFTNELGPVFELIDCEGVNGDGENGGNGESDCDCDAAEDEVICIADEFGNIMPVPACDFQCNGDVLFPNATVVDCELIDGEVTELDCDCTGQEEEIVCVQDETGAQFPISACLYECFTNELGPVFELIDCEGVNGEEGDNSDGSGIEVETDNYSNIIDVVSMYPNPLGINGEVSINLTSKSDSYAVFKVIDLTGKEVFSERVNLVEGNSTYRFDLHDIVSGLYITTLNNTDGILMNEKIIIK